jgi:hypothetical protein
MWFRDAAKFDPEYSEPFPKSSAEGLMPEAYLGKQAYIMG